jgi:hypothetical protein
MKKRLFSLVALIAILAILVTPVSAQDYLFRVDKVDVNFYVNQDGTASVEYTYDFTNTSGGHIIDFVDIGLPNEDYDLGSITAEVDGRPITDIQRSDFVDHGVALGLGANAIPAGGSGQVHVWVPVIRNLLNPASSDGEPNYVSVQFSPNYFGSQYVQGNTDMAVTLILPPGLTQDQPRYFNPQNWPGSDAPESSFTTDNRIIYHWQSTQADSSSEYIFGASFPASVVPADAVVAPPTRSFEISEDTGGFLCCGAFGLFWAAVIGFSIVSGKNRKLKYLPPKISVEGHGIKRGLTAVEAAVLMEQPVDRVMTMILFSVVKKGAAKVTDRDPVKIEAIKPRPEALHAYETDFLEAFIDTDARARRKKLQDVTVGLVKSVTEKMRGFSRKETVAYYENIMKQAWAQVEAADTPEVKSQKFDEYMGWTMLDKDYSGRTQRTFSGGPVFVPMWWGNWDPGYRPTGGGLGTGSVSTPGGGGGGGGQVSMPTLPGADFAASMVNGVQSFAAGVIGDVGAFTGAVTNVTNPPPPPSKSSYRGGGGGGSCACACACAGCACACAGGGR